LIASAHRDDGGDFVIKTWRLRPKSGQIDATTLDTYTSSQSVQEIALAAFKGSHPHLIAAVRNSSGRMIVRWLSINRETGRITLKASRDDRLGSRLTVTCVKGYDGRSIFALAFRNNSGQLAVSAYELGFGGVLLNHGTTVDASTLVDADGRIDLAP
jgi:hypothetical protein